MGIPALDGDLTYTQVSAGELHTVLLRSDGAVVACGQDDHGQCNIPALDGDLKYRQNKLRPRVILQARFRNTADSFVMHLCFLSGVEHSQTIILPTDVISDVLARLGRALGAHCPLEVLMPSGELLSMVNSATFAPFLC